MPHVLADFGTRRKKGKGKRTFRLSLPNAQTGSPRAVCGLQGSGYEVSIGWFASVHHEPMKLLALALRLRSKND